MEYKKRVRYIKYLFFILVIFILLPIPTLFFVSNFYHEIYDMPKVENGVLDLKGYDLQTRKEIPLEGEWEFFYDKWIITESRGKEEPDYLAKVPLPFRCYGDERFENIGKASYRIFVKNYAMDVAI